MSKNNKSPQTEEEKGFKRIKEQRKPIKNFKSHLKDLAKAYLDDEDYDFEDGVYYRKRDK
jgi:hypothetical protein